ncbi:IS110 family transposase [Paenibacillus mucilaginosus]|uniref:Transposase IS116/IS110/IS902 family protein n=3 Tax=Paenibacillus mucilaginosus TaxID=61624 RepID=H6NEK3_9BACL|nr:IS110 family transposase [Paenibacillus mucilaginosus]AFC28146.1 transposase IS116/IS110/IS902 family protein [Paenibacillus mucilaginosus 3016]WDM28989.1 IS110 family transposase [Paenibacillus mucilaginosus]WFA16986.1 IS110 family transposase [Paenibacillus mucilaginosus]
MKSNLIKSQNQRVERISTSTLVIGIDIAKEKHAAQAINFRGIVLTKRPILFSNDLAGFEHLEQSIRKLQKMHGMNDVVVGMESTGHYWFNIANWLVGQGIDVALVNPMTTKRNKENRDNSPSKSDPKDALVIADAVSRGFYTPFAPKDEAFRRIRVMVTNREHWVVKSGRIKNRIHRWLDIRFPEYRQAFDDIFSDRSLATLRRFPAPSDILQLTSEQMVQIWSEYMTRPGGERGKNKALELQSLARHSVGDTSALEEDKWELRHLIEEYERIRRIIDEADQMIEKALPEIPCSDLIRSVGASVPATAAILAFGGDLRKLSHGKQLLRKAGLNLAERSSGKYKGQIKLTKRGNSLLRKHLYFTVFHLLSFNGAFQAMHVHNTEVKRMTKMQSMMKLIGKLARILVALAREGQAFSPDKAQPPLAA